MILITGATGHLGRAVLQTLAATTSPHHLVALVRDADKAADLHAQGIHIRVGDYSDRASLDRAMEGVTKVLLISGGGEADALQQHYNVVDAARQAGVQCLAYTSRALKDPSTLTNQLMERHFQTEDYIKASGLPYVLFRNILYMEALPQFTGPQVLATGIILPAGEGKVAFALRSEMGEAIAHALLENTCANNTYYLTGGEAYSFHDVAAALTTLSGKPVAYTPVEAAEFEKQLAGRGVPAVVVPRIVGFMTDIKHGQEEIVSSDLEQLLGRKPATLSEGIASIFSL
ncbi:SDR family oxidoreductase (plasmid) [Hymenobacter tibetensis]|uniref:SDR family oxidoreductase n=1 Tax=Hymenobacter tibetensis TaxID=497967 RepID=A0ABY4D457_9BACT|nr:SDR family oxidoreductase [Hymenobacter tibetensis]UOG77298.1 SDR family oxidoreductase [Hymenobacter tibetensis]